jgi:hypothetical protein
VLGVASELPFQREWAYWVLLSIRRKPCLVIVSVSTTATPLGVVYLFGGIVMVSLAIFGGPPGETPLSTLCSPWTSRLRGWLQVGVHDGAIVFVVFELG